MNIQQAIKSVIAKQNLNEDQMHDVMNSIMTGQTTDAQIGAFLIGLSMKGETIEEITASAKVMRALATPVEIGNSDYLVDTCGTGGDGLGLFNISTASAFVVAAAGGKVAKHGNRSISSKSGSADVLESAGVNLDLSPRIIGQCVKEIGVGFMFAPAHHSAMKHVVGPRKEIGQKSIFNILGPLTNPASAKRQVLGVYDKKWMLPMAEVLRELGSEHLLIVHALDGLDEISIASPTLVVEMKEKEIFEYEINPEDFKFKTSSLDSLRVSSPKESLDLAKLAMKGNHDQASAMVSMAAGAALYVSGINDSLNLGIENARSSINNAGGIEKLNQLIEFSSRF